jgi:hypothetical protein
MQGGRSPGSYQLYIVTRLTHFAKRPQLVTLILASCRAS